MDHFTSIKERIYKNKWACRWAGKYVRFSLAQKSSKYSLRVHRKCFLHKAVSFYNLIHCISKGQLCNTGFQLSWCSSLNQFPILCYIQIPYISHRNDGKFFLSCKKKAGKCFPHRFFPVIISDLQPKVIREDGL